MLQATDGVCSNQGRQLPRQEDFLVWGGLHLYRRQKKAFPFVFEAL